MPGTSEVRRGPGGCTQIGSVTLRIETARDGEVVTMRLIGRADAEHVNDLRDHMLGYGAKIVLDLDEIELVDVSAVRFFVAREAEGVELVHCPRYIREWMDREQLRGGDG